MPKKVLLLLAKSQQQDRLGPILAENEITTESCLDARQAINVTLRFQPDVIVCSEDMPIISGLELARLFKNHDRLSGTPFLLLSTRKQSLSDLKRAGLRIDADDLIQLPVDQTEFLTTINEWLNPEHRPTNLAARLVGPLQDSSRTVKPWFRGRVSLVSFSRLLLHLIRHGESGVLRIKGDRRHLKVLVQSGAVVEVESNYIREDTLGRHLVQISKISQRENETSLKKAMETGVPQGQVLVQMNVLEPNEIDYYLAQQKIHKVRHVFTALWDKAAFQFTAERLAQKRFSIDPEPLAEILKTGILADAEPTELYNVFARNRKENAVMEMDEQFDHVTAELRLDNELRQHAITLVNKSITQLRLIAPDRCETYLRLAFLLTATKALRFSRASESGADKARPLDAGVGAFIEADEGGDEHGPQWDTEGYRNDLAEGRTFFNRGDFRGALHFLDKALEANPESSEALAMRAWCLYELSGRQNITVTYEAKEALKRAISLDDTNDEAYLLLGRIFKAEGKDSLAGTYFRRANECNPANEEARREVKLLQIKKRRSRDLGIY
jgi:DNA-binding response OmpR family regulator/tetratricopeptide (TPR) repeat protein